MILTLQLRHDPAARSPAGARFFSGDDPARWLDELARSGLAQSDTRLFIISGPTQSPITGLLAIPGSGFIASSSPAAIPLRLLAGRLFIPGDATLYPPVTDAEIRDL